MFLAHTLNRYQEAGYKKALLLVTATNEPAVRLYRSMGFEVEDTHTVDVGTGESGDGS
jgi:ribosomal protein S18 acetylase RimI-like enzyme